MNTLDIGANKTFDIDLTKPVLVIDDGPMIDALDIRDRASVTVFDVSKHHFDLLSGMTYRRALDTISILDAIFPEGENTLTKKNANFVLLNALLDKPRSLDSLVSPDPKDPAKQDAYQKIQTLLLSPVLRSVLCNKRSNFAPKGVVLARLDRAAIGDRDAFVLASVLVSNFKGQVVIPDFGFYGRDFHMALIREDRLSAGLNFLAEVQSERLRQSLLTIPQKRACGAIYDDAVLLALHAGEVRGTDGFDTAIKEAMGLV